MATNKRTRLSEIYLSEKKQGGDLGSTLLKAAQEKIDLRKVFNQKGLLAEAFPMLFKAYSATAKDVGSKGVKQIASPVLSQPTQEISKDSSILSDIKVNTSISAENSMAIPMMARDTNLMRLNMVKMVKALGGKPSLKTDMFFKRSAERSLDYKTKFKKESAQTKKTPTPTNTTTKEESSGGIFGGIGSLFGGILGGTGSIVGSIFGGLIGIAGGAASILGTAARLLGGLGIGGVILAIGAGSLIAALFNGINFSEIATQIGNVISEVVKNIKTFFGIESEGGDGKNFFEKAAEFLDNTFKTSGFSQGLANIITIMQNLMDSISYQSAKLYNDVTIATVASLQTLGDVFIAVGKDIRGIILNWIDENAMAIYGVIGASIGAVVGGFIGGPAGAAIGAAIAGAAGVGAGALQKEVVAKDREKAVTNLTSEISNLEMKIANLKQKYPNAENPTDATMTSLKTYEFQLAEKKNLLQNKKQEIEERTTNNLSNLSTLSISERLKQKMEGPGGLSEKYPEPTRPVPRPMPYPQGPLGNLSPTPTSSTTKEGMSAYKPRLTTSQLSGLDILSRAMDKEGITDQATRDRIVKLAMKESSLNPDIKGPVIPSGMHKGDQAHGLLQIMPKTAEDLGFSREQIQNPEIAAIAGVRYFKQNLQSFNNNLDAATVAHHAGPEVAKKWLQSGSAGTVDLATGLKTDDYLKKITGKDSSISLAATAPVRPADRIATASQSLEQAIRSSMTQPVIVNAPTTNNVQQAGTQGTPQYTAPSIVDGEFMKLLVSRAT